MSETMAPETMGASETMGESNFMARVFGEESGVQQAFGLGVWFGAWRSGKLGRIGYIVAAFVLYGMLGAIQWFILDALKPEPFQLTPTSEPMSEFAQMATVAASLAMSVLTLVVGLNIAAKRIRAIGAPGWGGALVLTLVNGAALFAIPDLAYPWLAIAIMALLMVLPNGLLGKRAKN
jgi:uncharacterized membrane protein YhaH (DUF805 family)